MYAIGYMYYNGEGVEQDYAEAMEWFEKAAEQGSAEAMYAMGYMYHNGEGVEQDAEKAAEWGQKAMDAGYRP